MRKISILAIGAVIALSSCQKSSVAPSSNSLDASTSNDVRTNKYFLTSHTWMYNKYYIGYVDSANKGTLAYRRGRAKNSVILDNTRVTYYKDGTATQIDENGSIIPCTWHFTNSAQTEMITSNYTGDYYTTIVRLDRYHFNWYYTDINGVKRYGEYTPAN